MEYKPNIWDKLIDVMADRQVWWKRVIQWPVFLLTFTVVALFVMGLAIVIVLLGLVWPLIGQYTVESGGKKIIEGKDVKEGQSIKDIENSISQLKNVRAVAKYYPLEILDEKNGTLIFDNEDEVSDYIQRLKDTRKKILITMENSRQYEDEIEQRRRDD